MSKETQTRLIIAAGMILAAVAYLVAVALGVFWGSIVGGALYCVAIGMVVYGVASWHRFMEREYSDDETRQNF